MPPHDDSWTVEPKAGSGLPGSGGPSSVELVRRARAGDQRALDQLCDRFLPVLRRWATGRLPRWARGLVDTDDLIQETLVNTMRNIHAFEPRHDGAVAAYLRQALNNRIRDELRNAGRKPRTEEVTETVSDPSPSPLESAIGADALERYESALERLTSEERELIVARIELGYSYDEVASAMNKPTSDAARMAVTRALVRLASEMGRG